MRQPEVVRPVLLALAGLLVLPVVLAAWSALLAAGLAVEFLAPAGGPLSRLTATPSRSAAGVPGLDADRYRSGPAGTPLVLVHGLAPEGKEDPRLRRAAEMLARVGFDVIVPTIPGLEVGRMRPADVEPVVAAIRSTTEPTVVVAVSVGAGPALLAAADPRVRDQVTTVLSLGGYASARELVRFYLAGEYRFAGRRGRVAHDPALVRAFVEANADLLPPGEGAGVPVGNAEAVDRLLEHLAPEVAALLDRLSPERVARDIRARLILVHGRADPAVPYTESLRLAAARPERTDLVLLGVVEHVERRALAERWTDARDALALWAVAYRLVTSHCAGCR